MPSKDVLSSFYFDYFDVRADPKVVELNSIRNHLTLKKLGLESEDKVLDFGSGTGVFVYSGGVNFVGYEPMAPFDEDQNKDGGVDAFDTWMKFHLVVSNSSRCGAFWNTWSIQVMW